VTTGPGGTRGAPRSTKRAKYSGTQTKTLIIYNCTDADEGGYGCFILSFCGNRASNFANLTVIPGQPNPPCPADFNQDGGVDGADVDAFFEAWEAGHASADVFLSSLTTRIG